MTVKNTPLPLKSRLTRQRRLILETLRQDFNHPTAEDIYSKLKKLLPHVSLATVYRNLKFLVDHSLTKEIIVPSGPSRFEGHRIDHDHFICHVCKRIYNLPKYPLRKNYLPNKNYKIGDFKLDLFGVCAGCHNQEPCLQIWRTKTKVK